MLSAKKTSRMKLFVQSLFLGLAISLSISLSAQLPIQSEFLKRHQVDEYCGSSKLNMDELRAPEGDTGARFTGCGTTLGDCYSGCTPTIPTCKYRVPIVFTVITDGSGNSLLGNTESEVLAHIDAALARCNNYYAGAGIEFVQCQSPRNSAGTDTDFNSADFYAFDAQSPDNDDAEIGALDLENVINIYLAPAVTSGSGNSVCGYAKFPGMFTNGYTYDQSLRSVIKTSCVIGDNTTLEHELGHFFGLEHTHNGASSSVPNEASDGSEACDYSLYNGSTYSFGHATASIGDGIADTSPDPNVSGNISTNCTYNGTYSPHSSQPLQLQNIMSYSHDFYCSKMVFTSCQLEKIQEVLLNCRDILICTSAAPDLLAAELDVCVGTKAPTFVAASNCFSWYSASSGGSALATSSQTFTPPMSSTDLNTPGSYTYYVEYDNEFYNTSFSGNAYDTYLGHPASPSTKRKAITVNVNAGACNSTPGDGVDACAALICEASCNFTTSGANFSSPFTAADYRTGWAVTSGAGTSVGSQADIDALPSGQVFGPYAISTPQHNFVNSCTAGVPDLAVGTYNATPFASQVEATATTTTFSSGVLSRTISSNEMVAEQITVSGLPDDATVSQICVTLTHNYAGVVSINAGAPEGMGQVVLTNRIGFPANRPYGSQTDYNGQYCFEAGAGNMPEPTSGQIATGTYAPHDVDFSSFNPKNPNGGWALAIDCPVGGVTGTLTNWSITFDVPAVTFPTIDPMTEGAYGESIEFDIVLALPIELTAFTGHLKSNGIQLNWRTENEENNSHFVLQRSRDGVYFEPIAEIQGAGNSQLAIDYTHLDNDPFPGNNYYRLITVDFDARVAGSEVVVIDNPGLQRLRIAPNPVLGDQLNFAFAGSAGKASIELRAITGQLLQQQSQVMDNGKNNMELSIEGLATGVYFLVLRQDGAQWVEKFTVGTR